MMYSEAQLRIDDKTDQSELTQVPYRRIIIHTTLSLPNAQGLRKLNALAKILKQRRLLQGALFLASPEVGRIFLAPIR